MDRLVSTEWLAAELRAADLRVIDASFYLPDDGRDARAEYQAGHVPGAVFMDLAEIADSDNVVPGMLPPAHKFASRMRSLGVSDGNRVVIYDDSSHHSAARAWWMLRTFGVREVALLDGGLAKWKAEGRPLETGTPQVRSGHFTPVFEDRALADKERVASLVGAGTHEIVDARSAERFAGDKPEPRPGVEPGHIPGSKSLPQGRLFNADNSWKRDDALRGAFAEAGVDLARPMVTTCGSGVTAAVLLFGAGLLGKDDVALYAGSWAEWGADPAAPKAKGAA